MNKYDLTHARHDPAHCLAPGLFRSLAKGERKRSKLDVIYSFGDNQSMRFVGFEPLGADDLRFLQGIVAAGGPSGLVLTAEPISETGQKLRALLRLRFEAAQHDGLVIQLTLHKLLAEVGMTDGGENIKSLRASLLRMSNVTVLVANGQRQESYNLMSHAFDESDGRLWVALNPRMADSIIGNRPYARIDLAEVRALKTNPARLIHQRLCGWIDPGKAGKVALDSLCGYAWPDPAQPETIKKRRQTARKALAELAGVGWTISEYSFGKWKIGRPAWP